MFTGIITHKGKIINITHTNDKNSSVYFRIQVEQNFVSDIKLGDSIAINGTCLTVIDFHDFDSGQCWFDLQLIPETISKTSFSTSNIGDIVNLEKAIILGQRLDGHLVQGHIDGVGVISSYIVENDSWVIAVNIPKDLQKYISYKGSITINGVSLTISQKTPLGLEVSLIKHTIEKTNLGTLTVGSIVNIEIDVIARYVENLLQNKFNN